MTGASLGPPGFGKLGSTYPAYFGVGGPDIFFWSIQYLNFLVVVIFHERFSPFSPQSGQTKFVEGMRKKGGREDLIWRRQWAWLVLACLPAYPWIRSVIELQAVEGGKGVRGIAGENTQFSCSEKGSFFSSP